MSNKGVGRREFCAQTCNVLSLAAVAAILDGCSGSPTSPGSGASSLPTITGVVSNRTVTLTIDMNSALASIGAAAFVPTSSTPILVTRTAQDTFVAVTAVCTHEGCTITGLSDQTFVCPCHGSEFNSSGSVVRGPAIQALTRFTTQFAGNVLTITF